MTRRTPLYDEHVRLGGKIVEFAGWDMPVQYSGVIDEHLAVRNASGLFDVSHMGQIEITGRNAEAQVQYLTTNDATKMTDGRAQYSLLVNDRGTVVDDIIVYRFTTTRYILVVNASNVAKDFAWCVAHKIGGASMRDVSTEFALIAFQGPKAPRILGGLTDVMLPSIEKYHFSVGTVAGARDVIIARTGYTGEDGFEIFIAPQDAAGVWRSLLDTGGPFGTKPAGLGARDTLRLEMKYSLYGHEITEETNPLEAGLGWVVKLDKQEDFIGKSALVAIKARGLERKLAGFKMIDRGIPRQGYPIIIGHDRIGVVTSGTMSPSLDVAIGIAYVPAGHEKIGNEISVDIRGQARKAVIVQTPFYKK